MLTTAGLTWPAACSMAVSTALAAPSEASGAVGVLAGSGAVVFVAAGAVAVLAASGAAGIFEDSDGVAAATATPISSAASGAIRNAVSRAYPRSLPSATKPALSPVEGVGG